MNYRVYNSVYMTAGISSINMFTIPMIVKCSFFGHAKNVYKKKVGTALETNIFDNL